MNQLEYHELHTGDFIITIEYQPTNNLRGPYVVKFFANDLTFSDEMRYYFSQPIAIIEIGEWLLARDIESTEGWQTKRINN